MRLRKRCMFAASHSRPTATNCRPRASPRCRARRWLRPGSRKRRRRSNAGVTLRSNSASHGRSFWARSCSRITIPTSSMPIGCTSIPPNSTRSRGSAATPVPPSATASTCRRRPWTISSRRPARELFLFEHDLFGKPVPTFPDHALPLHLDGDGLILGLDADHDGFGYPVGGVAPEVRGIRRRIDRLARFDDFGADAVNLKSLLALDNIGELVFLRG